MGLIKILLWVRFDEQRETGQKERSDGVNYPLGRKGPEQAIGGQGRDVQRKNIYKPTRQKGNSDKRHRQKNLKKMLTNSLKRDIIQTIKPDGTTQAARRR